ncbi:unnamed protein product [Adineta steineri]|uniref:G-protein coupled receptors family 1 profile domain-containing protein n=1 Tax=Adineta steineri TaxID=433720 RepID=A0A814KNG5_9BILA|nr:unnamed protein product [Adineta steineri]CAF1052040.1 unnamed protein product [Adineta steineri]
MTALHQVVKRSLNDAVMISNVVAAGTDIEGSASNQLFYPYGIFVDVNLDLYVTDCSNDRVQLFQPGESNGITAVGYRSLNPTITLRCPSGIILDADKYLFIVDRNNHRIVASGLNGFRCLVGCYGSGSQSKQLNFPFSFSFDHSGNIFVTNEWNNRIQKFFLMKDSFAVSFNQPKFCPTATWNSNGITFANRSILGQYSTAVFVDRNNTIYVANQQNKTILIWQEESVNPTKIIHNNCTLPNSLFVTANGDVYIDDGFKNGQVQKWIVETNTFVTVMNVNSTCYGLFVDINNTLYCSMPSHHQVVKRSLNDAVMTSNRIAAGEGIKGSIWDRLDSPRGIFVDVNLDLYVADCNNNRVQLFQSEELDGITVTGSGSLNPPLNCPSEVVLDAEKYLFIMDRNNHRIVSSSLNGFRCLVGCNGMGSQSHQLTFPFGFSFDHSGNMFVTDTFNHRIQKFQYWEESCVNTSSAVQTVYASKLTTNSSTYLRSCFGSGSTFYYEAIQVTIRRSGLYTFFSKSNMSTHGSIYKDYFDPSNPHENQLLSADVNCKPLQFKFTIALETSITYILIVTTYTPKETGEFLIFVSGPNNVNLKTMSSPSVIEIPYSSDAQSKYSSQLTTISQTYSRDCRKSNYYYETIRVNVVETGYYALSSSSSMDTFGDIYKDDFNPMNPIESQLSQVYRSCFHLNFRFSVYLYASTKYILVVTTSSPNMTGRFSILTSGPNNITLDPYTQSQTSCFIGQKCQFYKKSIGVTLDDILRDEIRSNMTLTDQTVLVKINAALTMIMFVGGLINSLLSLLTFQSKDLRQVGCGIYLLASSITSFLTISMFVVKFWFVVLTQMDLSIRFSVVRGGCLLIEPLLKLCLYLDAWLNACVAIERAILVFKGVNFNKQKSQRIARWIILVLPFCIMGSIIHEPIHRELREVKMETNKVDINRWCLTRYSPSIQQYNTIILFFHLVGPCIINLCSALFIIFGSARQRSTAQTRQTLREHIYHQFNEHKQLLISPIILLILSLPRLIMSMLSECVNPSNHRLLFIFGYFISFTPSMLIFIIFVLPSGLYRKTFQESFKRWRRLIHQ